MPEAGHRVYPLLPSFGGQDECEASPASGSPCGRKRVGGCSRRKECRRLRQPHRRFPEDRCSRGSGHWSCRQWRRTAPAQPTPDACPNAALVKPAGLCEAETLAPHLWWHCNMVLAAVQQWSAADRYARRIWNICHVWFYSIGISSSSCREVSPELGMLRCGMCRHLSTVAGGPPALRAIPREGRTGFVSACRCGPPLLPQELGRPMQQMSTRRDPMRSPVRVGLALCAAVALYALAVVLLVSP